MGAYIFVMDIALIHFLYLNTNDNRHGFVEKNATKVGQGENSDKTVFVQKTQTQNNNNNNNNNNGFIKRQLRDNFFSV